ncbi:MAG: hypothetical protein CBE47_00260 [Pelagibacteraceae bacterium TMED287]|nr:MAG: hypothetical protein CBE47_00260 [Pelagibacteraceae bacterium TMED287]
MTLTNVLLFLILVTLTTYIFMPWKGENFQKESPIKILTQYIFWTFLFALILLGLIKFNFII